MSTAVTAVSMAGPASADEALSWQTIFGWSIGTVGPVTLLYVVNYSFMFFMTDLLGVTAALAGALIFAVRIYDIFADPTMGMVSDRTASRMGRRRPWLLAGGFLATTGCIALFTVPAVITAGGNTVIGAWILCALLLYFTGYTMFNVPYMAMPAEMTENYHQRTRLMSARVFFVAVSGLLGVSIAPLLIEHFGKTRAAYSWTAALLGAVSLAAMLGCVAGTANARATHRTPQRVPLPEQLRLALSNKPFTQLILAKLLLLLAMSSTTTSMFYFATHVLHRELTTVAQFGLFQTTGMLLSLPLWMILAKRFSKHHLFMACCAANAVILLSWLLATPSEPTVILLLRSLLIGCAAGGALLMGQALLPDTMEYDFLRSGLRREGAYSGVYSMVEKAGFALGPLIIGFLLSGAGYAGAYGAGGNAAQAGGSTSLAVYMGIAIVPAIASALALLALRGYGLTEKLLKDMTAANSVAR
jgi:glycoside/pentoside/hexuronide:cation symporter, GPH family